MDLGTGLRRRKREERRSHGKLLRANTGNSRGGKRQLTEGLGKEKEKREGTSGEEKGLEARFTSNPKEPKKGEGTKKGA